MIRQEQCDKVCRILDDVLANRPTERDSLIVATRKAFEALEGTKWIPCSERLPSENGKYIVTEKRYAIDDRNHDGKYKVIVEEVDWDGKWNRAKFFEITAWMPFPTSYEGE